MLYVCACLLLYGAELTRTAATSVHFRISVTLTCRSISLPSTTVARYRLRVCTPYILRGHKYAICARNNTGDVSDDLEPPDMYNVPERMHARVLYPREMTGLWRVHQQHCRVNNTNANIDAITVGCRNRIRVASVTSLSVWGIDFGQIDR